VRAAGQNIAISSDALLVSYNHRITVQKG
jgi:hypothetical protein